jgi:tetratricopeptide (TPR) repeat protein
MADRNEVLCARCGATILSDGPDGLCPSCRQSGNERGEGEIAPNGPAAAQPARRKWTLASAIGAIIGGGLGRSNSRRADRAAEAEAHFKIGNALAEQGKPDEAIAAYRKAIRLRPDYAEAHTKLGGVLMKEYQLDEAIAAFHRAFRINPDDTEVLKSLELALMLQGKPGALMALWREVIRIDPDHAYARCMLGNALRKQGQLDQAIAEFRELIRIEPGGDHYHYKLGCVLWERGKPDEAIAALRTAIRINPDAAEVHYMLGIALDGQGRTQEALVAFREALRLEPDDGATQNGLALVLAAFPGGPRSDYEEAQVHATRAVEQGTQIGSRYNTLALAEYRLGHWAESLAATERATALQTSGDAFTWFLTALAGEQQGEKDKARGSFDKAVAWMKEHDAESPTLSQLWTEAAELLGRPGPRR